MAGETGPVVVREASFGQMGTLSTDARAVLEAAAVLGTRAPTGPLTMMMAGLSTAALASATTELEGRGMLRPSPRHDALDFPNEGARQQVYRLVASDRRRALHAAAARALAAMPAGTVSLETTAEHERLAIVPRPRQSGGSLALVGAVVALVVLAALYYFLRT
jgi:hypothetical protein